MAAVPAVLVQVADAVVALLNNPPIPGTFNQKFTARRSYPTWKVPLEKLSDLLVDVVPSSHPRSELLTRDSNEYECRALVVLRRKFGDTDRQEQTANGRPLDNASIDGLVLLVEEIHEFLCQDDKRRLGNALGLDATWDSTVIQNTYIDSHLQDHQQFTGIIRVTYTARGLVTAQ